MIWQYILKIANIAKTKLLNSACHILFPEYYPWIVLALNITTCKSLYILYADSYTQNDVCNISKSPSKCTLYIDFCYTVVHDCFYLNYVNLNLYQNQVCLLKHADPHSSNMWHLSISYSDLQVYHHKPTPISLTVFKSVSCILSLVVSHIKVILFNHVFYYHTDYFLSFVA